MPDLFQDDSQQQPMQRYFLVEANTNYHSLFCYELKDAGLSPAGNRLYERLDVEPIFNKENRSQFFGNLNSLCVTKQLIKAPPIDLAPSDLLADADARMAVEDDIKTPPPMGEGE